ncbi:MAG TPA: CsbD family protein [Methylomirabilota bacterium]|nr:CsbD family protein [Methylomirabilota bacterium]
MNWEQIEGRWKQYSGQLKEKWGKLTDDDLQRIAGKRDQLVGKIQERYGIAKEEVERQIEDFTRTLKADSDSASRGKPQGAGR